MTLVTKPKPTYAIFKSVHRRSYFGGEPQEAGFRLGKKYLISKMDSKSAVMQNQYRETKFFGYQFKEELTNLILYPTKEFSQDAVSFFVINEILK